MDVALFDSATIGNWVPSGQETPFLIFVQYDGSSLVPSAELPEHFIKISQIIFHTKEAKVVSGL